MKKHEQVKKIIRELLKFGRVENFSKLDMNLAITKALWVNDDRSFKRWTDFLIHLGFLIQTGFEIYAFNFERITELEVIEPEQRKLFNIS